MSVNQPLEVFHAKKRLRTSAALNDLDQFLQQCIRDDREKLLMFESAEQHIKSRPSAELRIKLTTNLESIVQRLVKEEKARNRIPAMLRRHARCSKFFSDPAITKDDLSQHHTLFAEIIGYLYDKASYNRLFLEYEQLCFEDLLSDFRERKLIQHEQLQDNPFRMFLRLFVEGDRFMENLCDWLRDQRFPSSLYDARQVDYLVGLLGQKKKKKSKKKNKKKNESQQAESEDDETVAPDPEQSETVRLQETLDGMTLASQRLPCCFSTDFLLRFERQLPHPL